MKYLALFSACFAVSLWSQETTTPICGQGPALMRTQVRYNTPRGLGYSQGYTTLEGFFTLPGFIENTLFPFVDLRGHVFDNGKMAANAGMGFRYLTSSRTWGIYSYYDYRNTKRQHYNQVSLGFESLGRLWDFRLNWYFPVGWKHSPLFFPRFSHFSGNSLFIRRSQQFVLGGFNTEAGFHLDHFQRAPMYFATGPYYLFGAGKATWGGQLRAGVDFFDRYLRIEGNTSYDHFFKWIGGGTLSINIPFGKKSRVHQKHDNSCAKQLTLEQRALQKVDRFEILPVGQKQVSSPAKDPLTGLPIVAIFVNNLSASLGTYEDPYHSLAQAQNNSNPNDLIYVFPGDHSTNHMDTGIQLQAGQMLLGSSTSQVVATTAGLITIPPQTQGLPQITNIGGDVVTLSNNNTVSGFSISTDNGSGLIGNGITNLVASNNSFTTSIDETNGIMLTNPLGSVEIGNCTFQGYNKTTTGFGGTPVLVAVNTNILNSLSVHDCAFVDISSISISYIGGVFLYFNGGSIVNTQITRCSFDTFSGRLASILFRFLQPDQVIDTLSISDCSFTNIQNGAYGILSNNIAGDQNIVIIDHCSFSNIFSITGTSGAINLNADGGVIRQATVSNCTFSNLFGDNGGATAIYVSSFNSDIGSIFISNNSFSGLSFTGRGGSQAIRVLQQNTEIPAFVSITHNNISQSVPGFDGWAISCQGINANTCLNFSYNNATSNTNFAPYKLSNTGGILNLTPGSDFLLNNGTIKTSGTLGICTENNP